ncbi:hypothetical protein BH10ACI2_BH10ACI2_16810 [soil metagenome]
MDIAAEICALLVDDWLPAIYSDRIRTQRTRSLSIDIAERENQAEIQYTLLGIELKVGKKRFACPDLATARYMRVFARMGCRDFAIPYDITKISCAADDLETAWHRAILIAEEKTSGRPSRSVSQARSKLIKAMSESINSIGAGDAMPQFDRETRQRR